MKFSDPPQGAQCAPPGGPKSSPGGPKSSPRPLQDINSIYSNSQSTAERPLLVHELVIYRQEGPAPLYIINVLGNGRFAVDREFEYIELVS